MIYIVYSPIRLNSKKDPIAYLIGGFILIKRTIYEQIGGHKTVRHSFVEDKALGEILKTSGFNLKILEANNNLKSFSRTGFKNNFNAMQRALSASLIAPNLLIAFSVIIMGFIAFIIPYYLFFYDLYGLYFSHLIFSSLILFFMLSSYFLEFKNILYTNKIFVLFYPLSAIVNLFALLYCSVKINLGYDFIWSKRKYKKFKR
jgi:chlorobactene glucosyltransferase